MFPDSVTNCEIPVLSANNIPIMASKARNILIFGGTGNIGQWIIKAIVENKSDFGSITIFTSPNTYSKKADYVKQLKSKGVEFILGDVTSESDVYGSLNGFDTIISAVGRPVLETQVLLVKLFDKHPDVKRFFPSEYGTDIDYDETSKDEPTHQLKLKVRAALKEVKNLEYTYVVTGPFADAEAGFFLSASAPESEKAGTFDIKRKRAVVLGTGDEKLGLTTMRDTGRLVVAALKHPEESKNTALKVNSFEATSNEVVKEFEKQINGQSWDVSKTSLEELKKMEKEAWEKKDPGAGLYTLKRIWTEGKTVYKKTDNEKIGMEGNTESLQDAVKRAIELQNASAKL